MLASASSTSAQSLSRSETPEWWVLTADGRVFEDLAEQDIFVREDSVWHVYPRAVAGSEQPFALLVTRRRYRNYRLTLEYRWGEKKFAPRHEFVRDAGVLVHVFDTTRFWPGGLECQIQEGDTGDAWLIGARAESSVEDVIRNFAPTGTPVRRGGENGQRFARFLRSYCWERPGWNEVDIEVANDTIRFSVNGQLVNALYSPESPQPEEGRWAPLRSGWIGLQAEGAEIYYRRIRITASD